MIEILICLFLLGIVIKLNKIEKEFGEYKYNTEDEIVKLIKKVYKLGDRTSKIGIGFSDSIGLNKSFKQNNFDG